MYRSVKACVRTNEGLVDFLNCLVGLKRSKMISNDQELIQSDPTSCPQTKREITKYINWRQFTKGTRSKPNEQLFPK